MTAFDFFKFEQLPAVLKALQSAEKALSAAVPDHATIATTTAHNAVIAQVQEAIAVCQAPLTIEQLPALEETLKAAAEAMRHSRRDDDTVANQYADVKAAEEIRQAIKLVSRTIPKPEGKSLAEKIKGML